MIRKKSDSLQFKFIFKSKTHPVYFYLKLSIYHEPTTLHFLITSEGTTPEHQKYGSFYRNKVKLARITYLWWLTVYKIVKMEVKFEINVNWNGATFSIFFLENCVQQLILLQIFFYIPSSVSIESLSSSASNINTILSHNYF